MTWLDVATFGWISASLVAFGLTAFPIYARTNTVLAQLILRGAALAALFFGVIATMLHVLSFGAGFATVFATGLGHIWLAQIALAALLAIIPARAPAWLSAMLAAVNICGFAFVGHANAIAGLPGAAIQSVHLITAGGWIGGLIALACALREAPEPQVVHRFARVGTVSVLLLAATGGALLFTNTGAALPMGATPYGQLAWIKIARSVAATALALVNRLFTTPRGAWRLLARVIWGELALLVAAVCAAVLLAQTEPYG